MPDLHVLLVCLCKGIDATLFPSFDAALAGLRERAHDNQWSDDEHFDYASADVQTLSDLYASGHDPDETWVTILPCDAEMWQAIQSEAAWNYASHKEGVI